MKITRKCLERRFFLTPDDDLVQILGYWLAVCLETHGLELHAACFMSNHYHLDVTDRLGNLPAFKQHFHSVIARAVNAHRRRFDKFWSEKPACDTALLDEKIIDGMAYTLANPVEAALVRRAERWPGLTTAKMRFGETRSFRRPSKFFDSDNPDLPLFATLRLVRPRVLFELSDEELQQRLALEVRKKEQEAERRIREEHRRFAGERRIKKQHWNKAPGKPEDRFTLTPRVAGPDKWARIVQLQRDRVWEQVYARSRDRLRHGEHDVWFPEGTYFLARFAGVRVERSRERPP